VRNAVIGRRAGCDHRLREPPGQDCPDAVGLEEVLAAEGSAADRHTWTVRINDKFLAAEPVVTFRASDFEVAGPVDVEVVRHIRPKTLDHGNVVPQLGRDRPPGFGVQFDLAGTDSLFRPRSLV
jgi:hypothetical protein